MNILDLDKHAGMVCVYCCADQRKKPADLVDCALSTIHVCSLLQRHGDFLLIMDRDRITWDKRV